MTPEDKIEPKVRNLLSDDDTEVVEPGTQPFCPSHEPMVRRLERAITGQRYLAEGIDRNTEAMEALGGKVDAGFARLHQRLDELPCATEGRNVAANTAGLRALKWIFAISATASLAVCGLVFKHVAHVEDRLDRKIDRYEMLPAAADPDPAGPAAAVLSSDRPAP